MYELPIQNSPIGSAPPSVWRERRLAALAILISSLLTLIVLEVLVRLVAPQNTMMFDDAPIRKNSWEFTPKTMHPGYVGVPVRINSTGLRGPEIATPKPPGVRRILAIGDSVTFGFGVRERETFASVVEEQLNAGAGSRRFEVVNAGVPGTGLDYYRYALEQFVDKVEADVVLVNIAMNDIGNYPDSRRQPWPTGRQRLDAMVTRNSHLMSLLYVRAKSLLYGFRILDINQVLGYDFMAAAPPSPEQDAAWLSSFAVIDEIRQRVAARGMKLVLAVFPIEPQMSAERLRLYQRTYGLKLDEEALEGKPQRKFAEYAARHGIDLIDLLPAFKADGRPDLYFRNVSVSLDPVHPSAKGHDLAGREIARALLAHNALAARAPSAKKPAGGASP